MNISGRKTTVVLLGLCFLAGCGSKENSGQYLQPQGLEALQVSLIVPESPLPEQETAPPEVEPEPEELSLLMEAEATGAEEEILQTLIRAADIYNAPSVEGTQIGTLKRGERVSTIGPAEAADWIKIEYNGRVAYIETTALKEQANAGTGGQTPTPSPGQNAGTDTQTPAPTPTPGQNIDTGTPTPLPEQTPEPTPPPEQTTEPTPPPEQPPEAAPTSEVSEESTQ